MRLDWSHWGYDFVKTLLRSVGVSGGAWLGIEVKYREINFEDLLWCILVGGVVRTVLHFLETSPLPEDLDAKVKAEVAKQLSADPVEPGK